MSTGGTTPRNPNYLQKSKLGFFFSQKRGWGSIWGSINKGLAY